MLQTKISSIVTEMTLDRRIKSTYNKQSKKIKASKFRDES